MIGGATAGLNMDEEPMLYVLGICSAARRGLELCPAGSGPGELVSEP